MTADTHCGACERPRSTSPHRHCTHPACWWWRCQCGATNNRTGNHVQGDKP